MPNRLALAVVAMQLISLGLLSGAGCSSEQAPSGDEPPASRSTDAGSVASGAGTEFRLGPAPGPDATVIPGVIRLRSSAEVFQANTSYQDVIVLVRALQREVVERLAASPVAFELTVVLGLHASRDHSIHLQTDPAIPVTMAENLKARLSALPTVRSRGPDLALELHYTVRSTTAAKGPR